MIFLSSSLTWPTLLSCLSVREGPWSVLKSEGVVGAWSKHGKKDGKGRDCGSWLYKTTSKPSTS